MTFPQRSTVLPQRAMAAARTAEAEMLRGDYRGPLHGIPMALKDLYDTKGIRTTASSRVMANRVPSEDATTTARLEAAGSILLGKLAMHEFALGGPDPTCGFPLARNPWNLAHIPGGSSSGSGTAWQPGSVWVRWGPVRVARSAGRRPIAAWWA
jgi:aspartyl-tRNA(Asn)/glutamyl-tRNA(Gln) amidotransferase subunit A